MIDLETIEREINELENRRDTTYSVCERLSWLYIVADHLKGSKEVETPRLIDSAGGSEFLWAVDGKPIDAVLRVIDEHMQALKIVQRREYQAIIDRLNSI